MKMVFRLFLIAISILFTGCQLNHTASNLPEERGEYIKIGAVFNLTGAQASLDNPSLNGLMLAAKEINDMGGVLGKKIKFITVNGKTNKAVTKKSVENLVDQESIVAIVGFSDSNFARVAGNIAQQKGIPFITTGATLQSLPEQVGDCFFMTAFGDDAQAYAIADFAVENLKAKRAYILKDTAMEFTVNLANFFKVRFQEFNGENSIVLEDTLKTGDQNFSSQIRTLKNLREKPDVLLIAAGPSECGLIVRQLREAGIKQPIISGDSFDTPLLLELGGAGANVGTYFATHASPQCPLFRNFIKAYEREYGYAPENSFAALGYDTMYILQDAINRARSMNHADVRRALSQTQNLSTVTGILSFSHEKRVPDKPVFILKVDNGRFVMVKQMVPSRKLSN